MDLSKNSEEHKNQISTDRSCSTDNTENNQNSTKYITKKMTITDFKVIRHLGKGAYAKVISVKNIHTGKNYALKVIDKTFIEREEKVEQVHIEKQLLSLFEHPNIIKLYSTFQNKKKLYFVLELAERGDLKEFITTQHILSNELAKFFTAEIVCALEYIHSKGFVHRDVKPENLILDKKYHLKLVDFATAACIGKYFDMKDKQFKVEGDEDNKYSLIGTAEYISPEMINEGKCGVGGDLWALGNKTFNSGCILYQFFHGYTPFFASTQHMIIQNIVNKNTIDIASTVSEEAKDLILQLLNYDADKRLGAGPKNSNNDYHALKRHKFFSGIDFNNLSSLDAPFKTNVIESPSSKKSPDIKTRKSLQFDSQEALVNTNGFNLNMNYICAYDEEFALKNNTETPKEAKEIKLVRFNSAENIASDDKPIETSDSRKEEIIYELKKKSPWFHYNTRKLILFPNKIEYFDPVKNIKKGEIILNKNCIALIKDDFRFELFTPKRTYLFKLDNVGSKDWSEKINCVIEELKSKK